MYHDKINQPQFIHAVIKLNIFIHYIKKILHQIDELTF